MSLKMWGHKSIINGKRYNKGIRRLILDFDPGHCLWGFVKEDLLYRVTRYWGLGVHRSVEVKKLRLFWLFIFYILFGGRGNILVSVNEGVAATISWGEKGGWRKGGGGVHRHCGCFRTLYFTFSL